MLDRFEGSTDCQPLTLCQFGMTPRKNLHTRYIAQIERLVVVSLARCFENNILYGSGNFEVLAVVSGGITDDLGGSDRLGEAGICREAERDEIDQDPF